MGMTIEDAILCLKGIKQYGSDTFTKRSQGDWQNSLDLAIDTIRKYQKIKRIIKAVDDRDIGYSTMMDALHKVVEDGNE